MPKDPWTDPDPQPGDFDADLIAVDPHCVEAHPGNPDATALPASTLLARWRRLPPVNPPRLRADLDELLDAGL
jgi:hypothetical protein